MKSELVLYMKEGGGGWEVHLEESAEFTEKREKEKKEYRQVGEVFTLTCM